MSLFRWIPNAAPFSIEQENMLATTTHTLLAVVLSTVEPPMRRYRAATLAIDVVVHP